MVIPFRRRACQGKARLAKETLLAYLTDGSKTKDLFLSMDINDWEITSFTPDNREVCILFLNDSRDITTTVILPETSFPSNDIR